MPTSAKSAKPEPSEEPEVSPDQLVLDGHGGELADTAERPATADEPERDPLDATREPFTDADADERGWLLHYELVDGQRKFHRVPVARWAAYEKRHGF
jgi:hypothetical protein